MVKVYIGLGSNLSRPAEQLSLAIEHLSSLAWIHNLIVSSFYQSKPQGPQDQPDFVNAVASFDTSLGAYELLSSLQSLELKLGKEKVRHWGERKIDLDILLYGDEVIKSDALTIPHCHLTERDFVLLPLQEIAPDISIPKKGSIHEIVNHLTETYVYPFHP